MGKIIKVLDRVFIVLIAITFIIPGFLSIDQVFPEFTYLSFIQGLILLYNILIKKSSLFNIIFSNKSLIAFLLFLIMGAISSINSTNFQLSIIEFVCFFTFFLTFLNSIILFEGEEKKIKFFVILFTSLLSVESLKVLERVYLVYDFNNPLLRSPYYAGFSSNVNVTAFSILFKLPVLIYFYQNSAKKYIHKILASFLFLISVSSIFILYSRAAILSLFLIISLYTLFILLRKRQYILKPISIILILIVSYGLNRALFVNANSDIIARVTTYDINKSDSSINTRLGYYYDAISGIMEKPFIGWGIGNWKIQSIKFAKDRIREYQVPYHTHNDFLQMSVETGLTGGVLYLLIFVYPFYLIIKKIIKNQEFDSISLFLLFSFIVFFIDSSFNFPRARPTSIVNICLLLSFSFSILKIRVNE